MNAGLTSVCATVTAEIDCHLSTYGQKPKKVRAGGKAGKRSCWKAYIMLDPRQTNLVRGHKNDFKGSVQ